MTWIERVRRLSDQARIFWKWALSYRKSEWDFEDYPLWVRDQGPPIELPSRFIQHRYRALMQGWLIGATGDSKAEALAELKREFLRCKQMRLDEGEPIPRLGTPVPIRISSRARLDALAELEDDFICRILHPVLGIEGVHMTDGSSLWNFHFDEDSSELVARIRDVYGIDVSDIQSQNIAEILERIALSSEWREESR